MHPIDTHITRGAARRHIATYVDALMGFRSRVPIDLQSTWKGLPSDAGVYALFEKKVLIYVGETGNLRKRIRDLRETRNHTLRRRLGAARFGDHRDYQPATSKRKFPESIEIRLNNYMERSLRLVALPVHIGRKEVEEWLIDAKNPRFNIRRQRR